MTVLERTTDPLAPVRTALLAHARDQARLLLDQARREADETVARAEQEARKIRDDARAQGEADAQSVVVVEGARARRRARAVVLRAQRQVYDDLRRRVSDVVTGLRDDPDYPAMRDRLSAEARSVLGPGATVHEDPGGGVVAELGDRRASCTLEVLAERVLDVLGPDVEGLWSP